MKYLRRLCSAFLCLALLLGVSSVSAFAASTDDLKITAFSYFVDDAGVTRSFGTVDFYPNDGEITNKNVILTGSGTGRMDEVYTEYTIVNKDGNVLFEGDTETRVKLENVTYRYLFMGTSSGAEYVYCPHEITVEVTYTHGVSQTVNATIRERTGSNGFDLEFTFTPSNDVQSISLYCTALVEELDTLYNFQGAIKAECYLGEYGTDSGHVLTVEQEGEEVGLLKNLLSSIGNWFKELFSNLTEGFQNVVDSVTELPTKIIDGIKNLFIPDEDFIASYKDKWDLLLSEKFGAVYQVVNVTIESWEKITDSDETNTIDFPEVAIALPEGNEFAFGGYKVKIVPDGFGFLATACKTIAGIVCTILFVNGLRKRYDEVMGVEE